METSASVCLRPVLPGRGSWTSCSSSRPGPGLASSQIAVSSRLLGETGRCRNPALQLVSTGKNKGCKEGEKPRLALRMGTGAGQGVGGAQPPGKSRPVLTYLKGAVEITVHLGLQDRLSQGLGLWAQQRGPERITRENFLRHLR